MRHWFVSMLLCLTAAVAGCGDKNSLSKAALLPVVNSEIGEIGCTEIVTPWRSIDNSTTIQYSEQCAALDRMVEVGVLSRVPVLFAGPSVAYMATEAYSRIFKNKVVREPFVGNVNKIFICVGRPEAVEIESFTVPAEGGGTRQSTVSFRWIAKDVPETITKLRQEGVLEPGYSRSCGHMDPFRNVVKFEGRGELTVVQTSEGWSPVSGSLKAK